MQCNNTCEVVSSKTYVKRKHDTSGAARRPSGACTGQARPVWFAPAHAPRLPQSPPAPHAACVRGGSIHNRHHTGSTRGSSGRARRRGPRRGSRRQTRAAGTLGAEEGRGALPRVLSGIVSTTSKVIPAMNLRHPNRRSACLPTRVCHCRVLCKSRTSFTGIARHVQRTSSRSASRSCWSACCSRPHQMRSGRRAVTASGRGGGSASASDRLIRSSP